MRFGDKYVRCLINWNGFICDKLVGLVFKFTFITFRFFHLFCMVHQLALK